MEVECSSKVQKRKITLKLNRLHSAITLKLSRHHNAITLKLNRHVLIWGTESLQNVSTQLVLFWINEQPAIFKSKIAAPPLRFSKLCNSKAPEFENLATELGKDAREFADDLDQMIQNRNKTIHFPSWDILKVKVRRVEKLLADRSQLETENPFEAFIVKNFSIFWKHYNPNLKVPRDRMVLENAC